MTHRFATTEDCALLAQLNQQLLHDEGHRNREMALSELERRMMAWLEREYKAVIFEEANELVAYGLFREAPDEIYLRQLFVVAHRRREGIGRRAVQILRKEVWPANKRLTVDVLVTNTAALAFWRTVGYRDYCLTLEILPGRDGNAPKASAGEPASEHA